MRNQLILYIFDKNTGLKTYVFLIKLVIGTGRSRTFFKTDKRLSFNFVIMVTGNRFFKDISKTIITVNRLIADE
jgi:hypothetical protein